MAALEKFLFDVDFGQEVEKQEKVNLTTVEVDPMTIPKYSEIDMKQTEAAAQTNGYNEGHSKGQDQARTEIRAQLFDLLTQVTSQLENLIAVENMNKENALGEAVGIAEQVGKKLAYGLITQQPMAEIKTVIAKCMEEAGTELLRDQVTVKVAPDLVDATNQLFEEKATQNGTRAPIKVISDESLSYSDCIVEWSEGGAERRTSNIEQKIDVAIERYLQNIFLKNDDKLETKKENKHHSDENDGDIDISPEETDVETMVEGEIVESHEGASENQNDDVKEVGGSKSIRYED